MAQSAAVVTASDVDRLVRRDFDESVTLNVISILNEYGLEDYHKEEHRVRAAVLKLAECDLSKLRYFIDRAKIDYRDVLYWAEYPGSAQRGCNKLSGDEKEKVDESDRKQYQEWFSQTKKP